MVLEKHLGATSYAKELIPVLETMKVEHLQKFDLMNNIAIFLSLLLLQLKLQNEKKMQ